MDIALVALKMRIENENDEKGTHSISHSAPDSHFVLQYAGAHNPLWLIRRGSNEVEEYNANKQPIGKFDLHEPFQTHTIEIKKGDTIYIFSDGFADQFGGEKGKKFKGSNFKNLLLQVSEYSMDEQHELINKAFEDWKGQLEQLDDVCVIGVRI